MGCIEFGQQLILLLILLFPGIILQRDNSIKWSLVNSRVWLFVLRFWRPEACSSGKLSLELKGGSKTWAMQRTQMPPLTKEAPAVGGAWLSKAGAAHTPRCLYSSSNLQGSFASCVPLLAYSCQEKAGGTLLSQGEVEAGEQLWLPMKQRSPESQVLLRKLHTLPPWQVSCR